MGRAGLGQVFGALAVAVVALGLVVALTARRGWTLDLGGALVALGLAGLCASGALLR